MAARYLTFIITILFWVNHVLAQDMHFSQFADAPLLMNPALTGEFDGKLRVAGNYRNQWGVLDKGYNSFSIYLDTRFDTKQRNSNSNISAGLAIFRDRAGVLGFGRFEALGSIAYRVQMTRKQSLNFGLRAGFGQFRIDQKGWEWGNQYDGTKYDPEIDGEFLRFVPKSYSDFSAGVNWSSGVDQQTLSSADERWFNIGFAAHHLITPKINALALVEERLEMRYVGHARFHIGIKNVNLALEPSVYYSAQGKSNEIIFGNALVTTFREGAKVTGYTNSVFFVVGLHYRWNDAVIPSVGYRNNEYTFTLSYDLNVSGLRSATNLSGGPEMMFKYILPSK